MKTLIIDNYDSFTFNLFQYLGELGGKPKVYRNNEISIDEIDKFAPTHIVISPGPGTVENKKFFGVCKDVILEFGRKTPLLGVCLGHQGIISAFGGGIEEATEIMHGKTSMVRHDSEGIFRGVLNPFEAMRYHSLVGSKKTFPKELKVTARLEEDDTIMGIQHKKFPIFGVQFHPESIGTPEGKKILKNFLKTQGTLLEV